MNKPQDSFPDIEIEKFLLKIRGSKPLKKSALLEQFASKEMTERFLKHCLKEGYVFLQRGNSRNLEYSISEKGKAFLKARGKDEKPKKQLFKPAKKSECVVHRVDPRLLRMGFPVDSIIKDKV